MSFIQWSRLAAAVAAAQQKLQQPPRSPLAKHRPWLRGSRRLICSRLRKFRLVSGACAFLSSFAATLNHWYVFVSSECCLSYLPCNFLVVLSYVSIPNTTTLPLSLFQLATEPVIQPIAVISDYVNRNVDVQINVLVDYIPKESSVPRRASVSSISALSNAIGSSSSPASKFSSGAALSAAGVNGHDQSQSVMGPSQSFQSQSAGLVLQQQQQQSFPKTSSSLGSNSLSAFENQHSASSRPVVPMSVFVSAPVKGRVTGFAPPVLSPDSQLHQQQIVLPQAHESSPASQTSPNFAAFSSPFPSAPSAFGSPSLQPQANPQSLLSSALSSAINGDQSAVDYFSAPSGQHSTQQQAVKYPNQHRESIGSASNGVPPRHPPPFVSGTPPSPMLSARTPPQAINQPVSHGSSSSQQPQHHLFQSSAQTSSASPHLLPSMLPTSSASSVAAGFMLPSNVMTSLSSSPSSFSGASHQQHLLQQHQQQQQQQRLQHQQSSGYTHPLPPLPPVSHSPAVSRPLSPVFATGSPSGMRRISSQEAMGLVSVGSASNLSSSPLITNPLGPGAISAPRSQRRGSSSSNSKAQEAPPFVASGQVPHSQPASFQPQFLSPPPSQQNSSHSSSAISFGTTPPSPVLMAFQQSNHNLATVSEFNGFTALPASASFSNSADYARGQASVPLSINQQSTASSTRRHQRADSMVSSGAGSLPTGSFPGSSHMLSFASHATAPASRSLNDFTLPPHSSLHHDLPRLLPAERPVSVTDLLGAVPLERTVDDDDDGPSFADASFGRAAGVGGAEPHAELGALISLLRVPSCTLNIFRHNSSSTRSMNSGGPPLVERVGKILDNLDRLNARFQSFI